MAHNVHVVFQERLAEQARPAIAEQLRAASIDVAGVPRRRNIPTIIVFETPDDAIFALLDAEKTYADFVMGVCFGTMATREYAKLRQNGAADIVPWSASPEFGKGIALRLDRYAALAQAMRTPIAARLVGGSPAWRQFLRSAIEIAMFSQSGITLIGESGTGKEAIARAIHDFDARPNKRAFVIVDCTTLTPELMGSELFGHERGAFTGAMSARDGSVALANGGTLFLDEIGELPLGLQAQLLRVLQERQYKRVGGNAWLQSTFRLVCATNRDLPALIDKGLFRADLYYRISEWVFRTPPLRDRREDILALAEHFLREARPAFSCQAFDPSVAHHLVARDYPGNVRELRQVVRRLVDRHVSVGPISLGDLAVEDLPGLAVATASPFREAIDVAIRGALQAGIGLKEIGQIAQEAAIQAVLAEENGNLQRTAARLGVTDRALQLRRANGRAAE